MKGGGKSVTLKEAILTSLDEIKELTTYREVCEHIIKKKYYDFGGAKTPPATVSALLGNFIRSNDVRVKRVYRKGAYFYYLSKYESEIDLQEEIVSDSEKQKNVQKEKEQYDERSLHRLLATYLESQKIYAKTVFHEKFSIKNDEHQTWIHPDIVGVSFMNLKSNSSKAFIKAVDRKDAFSLKSYELKRVINSDYELKKYYFQTVSNSSWANYGYLVALEVDSNLEEEIKRLSQAFGIGVIRLSPNPYQTQIIAPARYRELDILTLDKLCNINGDYKSFIDMVEKWISAEEKYLIQTEKELKESCDTTLNDENEAKKYCEKLKIPFEEGDFLSEV